MINRNLFRNLVLLKYPSYSFRILNDPNVVNFEPLFYHWKTNIDNVPKTTTLLTFLVLYRIQIGCLSKLLSQVQTNRNRMTGGVEMSLIVVDNNTSEVKLLLNNFVVKHEIQFKYVENIITERLDLGIETKTSSNLDFQKIILLLCNSTSASLLLFNALVNMC